jgi:hypothetical protein
MSLLPGIENGAIIEPIKKVNLKRPRSFRKSEYKQAKALWREWWKATEFIRQMK